MHSSPPHMLSLQNFISYGFDIIKRILRLLFLVIFMNLFAPFSTAQGASPYEWSHRPVYIFAPSVNHPDLGLQISAFLAQPLNLKDRQIVLISIAGNKVETHFGPNETRSAQILRRTYNIDPNLFTVILIGKDTGMKARHDNIIKPQDIFRQIDAMPMRLREMRQNEPHTGQR